MHGVFANERQYNHYLLVQGGAREQQQIMERASKEYLPAGWSILAPQNIQRFVNYDGAAYKFIAQHLETEKQVIVWFDVDNDTYLILRGKRRKMSYEVFCKALDQLVDKERQLLEYIQQPIIVQKVK